MKKAILITALLLATTTLTTATTNYQGPQDQPHIMNQPGNQTPDNTALPTLPDQASDTARQVLNNIQQFLSDNIENLGNALSNLLGGGN